jgi:hypothetical protein
MRRSPLTLVALTALVAALSIAACSKKEAPNEADPKAGDVDPGAVDAAKAEASAAEAPDAAPAAGKNRQVAMAEKVKAREAARKAAKAAREARATAEADAPPAPEGEPSDDEQVAEAQAGTPTPVTPAEAAAARAAGAAHLVARADGSHLPPGAAAAASSLVSRTEPGAVAPTPPAPAPHAEAPADAPGGVEFVVRDDAPLDLSKLVTLADVQKIMKKTALRESEPLAGSLPARDYNGVRFFAAPNETLGVAVQVWRFSTTIDARRRYDVYSSHYPNAEKTDAVATQGFFAQSGDLLYLGFLDQAKKAVAIVSCSEDACDMKDLYVLARDLQKKL